MVPKKKRGKGLAIGRQQPVATEKLLANQAEKAKGQLGPTPWGAGPPTVVSIADEVGIMAVGAAQVLQLSGIKDGRRHGAILRAACGPHRPEARA